MPGARLRTFRMGDRNELLAEFILSTFSFTTPVPRQEDVGHDFICALSELKGNLLWTGPSFTVQVKSTLDPLIFEKEHELAWIREQENSFLLGIVDRENLRLDLYSTWSILKGVLHKAARRIVLIPGPADADYQAVITEPDESEQRIPLGRPILSANVYEVMDENRAKYLGEVLREWVLLDRENLVNRRAGMYWVLGPTRFTTNKKLTEGSELASFFYWNPLNLGKCLVNFGRAATALRVVLRAALKEEGELMGPNPQMISDLERVLRSHAAHLDPFARKILRESVGLDLELPSGGGAAVSADLV